MKNKVMYLAVILSLASLAAAQVNPQQIINAKMSDGYYAPYLTEGTDPTDVLRQYFSLEAILQVTSGQPTATEQHITKIRAGLDEVHGGKSGRTVQRNDFKTCNMRTVYN